MNLLIAEDEKRVAHFLESALRAEGYTIILCPNFESLKDAVENPPYTFELAVLDRMLEGKDSVSLIKPLKSKFPEIRIIILSAINSSEEKALALDLGADDYLAKPYSLVELSARLRALTRRSPEPQQNVPVTQHGNITVDLLSHQVHVAGKRVDLSNKEFSMLQVLLRRPGQVFNKFQLLDKIWDTQLELESNVVESTVRNLRRKLEEAGATISINSKRNVGYWIET